MAKHPQMFFTRSPNGPNVALVIEIAAPVPSGKGLGMASHGAIRATGRGEGTAWTAFERAVEPTGVQCDSVSQPGSKKKPLVL